MISRFLVLVCFGQVESAIGADEAVDPPGILIQQDLRYREGRSPSWKRDLAVRKEKPAKPRPGIVIIHGGGWLEGDKSSFATRKHRVPGNIVDFAELGFVAVTINYRMSGEAAFPAALEDCKCAVRWLRAHAREYDLDRDHIGAYGNSAGGHLALLLGMVRAEDGFEGDGPYRDQPSSVQAVASDSGPVDLLGQYNGNRLREVVKRFLGGPPEGERAELYRKASPSDWIRPGLPPILLMYGGSDEQVPVASADRFVVALDKAGLKDLTYHRLAFVDHCPHSLARVPFLRPVVNEFFIRTLSHPETTRKVRRAGASD